MISQLTGGTSVGTVRRVFRRVAGAVAALVGIVFLIIGGFMLITLGWASATATVQSCQTQLTHTGTGTRSRVDHYCVVQWEQGGQVHRDSVNFGSQTYGLGQQTKVKVSGDHAVASTPAWSAIVVTGIGLVLAVGGGFYALKRSRVSG